MTPNEFDAWLSDHCSAFPDFGSWIKGGESRASTLARWREVFVYKRITLSAAREATRAMLCGDAESPKAFEREMTAAMIVRACRELRIKSGDVSQSEQELQANMQAARRKRHEATSGNPFESAVGGKIWSLVLGYRERKAAGATQQELEVWLDKSDREAFPQSYPRAEKLFQDFNNREAYL